MPQLSFDRVGKWFGDVVAVEEFTTEIPNGEFLVLVGPSGCGKSTLLRMIAGLTDLSSGTLAFDGRVVNTLSPRERDVGFVFQSYALYPHMTVRQNIGFPLVMERMQWFDHVPIVGRAHKRRLLRQGEVAQRVEEIAALMSIEEQLERRPAVLSGGQRQRVALARALAREPPLYLLDEPLSNLDAQLRTRTRSEISALHRRTGKTFIYVTHDQVEAMTMGTTIIVLNRGRIQQVGSPGEIYAAPENTFVAQFIGNPAMNLIECESKDGGLAVRGGRGARLPDPQAVLSGPQSQLLLGVRPERIGLATTGPDLSERVWSENRWSLLDGYVVGIERLGAEVVIAFTVGEPAGTQMEQALANGQLPGSRVATHHAKMSEDGGLELGQRCRIKLDLAGASWFDANSGRRLGYVLPPPSKPSLAAAGGRQHTTAEEHGG